MTPPAITAENLGHYCRGLLAGKHKDRFKRLICRIFRSAPLLAVGLAMIVTTGAAAQGMPASPAIGDGSLPAPNDSASRLIVDDLALPRYEMALSSLPADTSAQRRQDPFWHLYRPQIIAAGAAFAMLLLLALFLAGLSWQLHKARLALRAGNASLAAEVQECKAALSQVRQVAEQPAVELARSEARLRSYFELPIAGFAITSPEKGWLEVNEGICAILGYSAQELTGMTWAELTHPDDLAADETLFTRLLAGDIDTYALEKRFIHKNGTVVWTDLSVGCVRKPDRSVEYIVALLHDITARKQAETALQQSEAQYRLLAENMVDVIWTINPAGQFTYVSPSVTALRGYTPEEVLAQSVAESLTPASHQAMQAALDQYMPSILQTKTHFDLPPMIFELEQPCKDGSTVWTEAMVKTLFDETGVFSGFLGVSRNISDREKTEQTLRESEEKFRLAFSNANTSMCLVDLKGNLLQVNEKMCSVFGYSKQELESMTVNDLTIPDDAGVSPRFIGHAIKGSQESAIFNKRYRHRDGHIIYGEVSSSLVRDAQGQPSYFISHVQDLTERKRAEEELSRAKEAAEAANRAKSQFLASMSHELRTPLGAILGFSELMTRDPDLTDGQRQSLAIINRSGEHLLDLINDVLDLAKIESGRTTLQEHAFDLHRVLADLADMFRLRAAAKGLELRMTVAADVPNQVLGDERKLRQTLINLLGNAVKFTAAGSVSLHVQRVGEEDPPRLRFTVQDTGQGITAADLERIFEPFMQGVNDGATPEGTGLGLPISREFARLMGGDLIVSSTGVAGQGSRFEMEIVLQQAQMTQEDGSPLAVPPIIGLEPDLGEHRLLVVDDDFDNRKLLADLLSGLGFAVETAENGQQAIEIWQAWQPHLIWMDIRMPVLDGHEAARRIKALATPPAPVIIAVTASIFEDDRALLLADGCDDFVRKPFYVADILERLARHLGLRLIYADKTTASAATPDWPQVHTAFDLSDLPPAWIEQVRMAAVTANVAQLARLAQVIENVHPAQAAALRIWTESYDYRSILAAVETT